MRVRVQREAHKGLCLTEGPGWKVSLLVQERNTGQQKWWIFGTTNALLEEPTSIKYDKKCEGRNLNFVHLFLSSPFISLRRGPPVVVPKIWVWTNQCTPTTGDWE
jgi:hypothetical protein